MVKKLEYEMEKEKQERQGKQEKQEKLEKLEKELPLFLLIVYYTNGRVGGCKLVQGWL